jgi:hypothetical protein
MTKLYSIYLEVRNRQASIDAVCELFIGFTAFDSTGVWLKKQEPGLKIEIVTDEKFFGDIWLVAEEYCADYYR